MSEAIRDKDKIIYCEPFFGGGSVGLSFIEEHQDQIAEVVINDVDPAMADLWTAVIRYPNTLCEEVNNFTPSVDLFFKFKQDLLSYRGGEDHVMWGFKKLAIHQMSYSGLGTRAGGPIGGISQTSNYKIDCRWSPKSICKKIRSISSLLNKVEVADGMCHSDDFSYFLQNYENYHFLYLDPPYFKKGPELYEYSFTDHDHFRLCLELKTCKANWVLSYDCDPTIIEMYKDWSKIGFIDNIKYTINTSRESKEILICNK